MFKYECVMRSPEPKAQDSLLQTLVPNLSRCTFWVTYTMSKWNVLQLQRQRVFPSTNPIDGKMVNVSVFVGLCLRFVFIRLQGSEHTENENSKPGQELLDLTKLPRRYLNLCGAIRGLHRREALESRWQTLASGDKDDPLPTLILC